MSVRPGETEPGVAVRRPSDRSADGPGVPAWGGVWRPAPNGNAHPPSAQKPYFRMDHLSGGGSERLLASYPAIALHHSCAAWLLTTCPLLGAPEASSLA